MTTREIELIRKYNVAGPRYTSYPTVPFWDKNGIELSDWAATVGRSFGESNAAEGISIYVHLPFCESLCTFCGCHKHITKRHDVEQPYIASVLKEWELYKQIFGGDLRIKELHLGGGTPTFFSAEQLTRLISGILEGATLCADAELSFEGHPNHTSRQQLQALYDLGFRRCSFGVQDYDIEVQKAIHRIQPFEMVQAVTEEARAMGYTSISHDLVFGLPKQHLAQVQRTIEMTAQLRPDRIAYYSYAHVPWVKGVGQRGYDERDLPQDEEKRRLYELGKAMFAELGYAEVGMDHFALPTDSLYKAMKNNTLHRNFMGYTAGTTQLMVGLGMSAIGDSWYAFGQNVKTVAEYQQIVHEGRLPIFRGHLLSKEDLIIRRHILNLMCHLQTDWSAANQYLPMFDDIAERLSALQADGLIHLDGSRLQVLEAGRPFVRNVCMAFDAKLIGQSIGERMFSKTI